MLAGGGIGPFAGGALAAIRPFQPNEQAAAGRVRDIANEPVATRATTVGEIMAAHRLRLTRKTACQLDRLGSACESSEKKGPASAAGPNRWEELCYSAATACAGSGASPVSV